MKISDMDKAIEARERRYIRILTEAGKNKERERREEIRRKNARARELLRERTGR